MISTATARMVAPGHAAIEVLKANGVEVVFGLNGDHVLRLYDGLADLGGIAHVTVKHENNAALAAEAYGRLTGRPGVALTTAGPGALNSISGVASAMASGAPLVSLTGAVPNGAALETFHGVDEVDFTERAFTPITKSSRRVTRPADIQVAIGDAFALAVAGRPGPTHVEVTRDVLEGDPFDAGLPDPAPAVSAAVAPDLDQALERFRAARRPIIVAGKGAWYPLVSTALVTFAEALEVELERYAGTRPWHIGRAIAALSERLTPEMVVTSDVSNVKLWVPLQLRTFGPHSHVQAGSWGTMGYALPAALGAAFALPNRKVVGLAGDASFLKRSAGTITPCRHTSGCSSGRSKARRKPRV